MTLEIVVSVQSFDSREIAGSEVFLDRFVAGTAERRLCNEDKMQIGHYAVVSSLRREAYSFLP